MDLSWGKSQLSFGSQKALLQCSRVQVGTAFNASGMLAMADMYWGMWAEGWWDSGLLSWCSLGKGLGPC